LLCAIGGLIVGLVALPRRPADPLLVSVPMGEYDDRGWSVNPWADRDASLLVPRFGGSSLKAFGFQQRDRFGTLLAWVAGSDEAGATGLPPPDRRRPLILHLTALAVTRGGEVYVLPGDARTDNPEGWVNVRELLRAAADRNAPHTFLILDLAHPVADPFGGVLGDDVAATLNRVLEGVGFPVLTSCAPGETSLPADAAGCSAFAFYLAEGLGGTADGYADPRGPDGDVTIRELARFTAARVDRWARLTHGRRQTPALHGPSSRAADFVLVRRPGGWSPEPSPPSAYPGWLRDAWQQREAARGGLVARRDPLAFARLTAGLLRAEELWHRPGTAHRAEDAWRTARDRWAEAVIRVPAPPFDWTKLDAVAGRLAVARAGKPDAPPELTKALNAVLAAKPDQEPEAEKAWAEAARPHSAAAVGLVWKLAVETARPTAEMVERWARAATSANPIQPLAETRLLRALAERGSFRRQKLAAYPSAAVAALTRAEDELGRVVALEPEEFATACNQLTAAALDRRAGAAKLFESHTAEQVAAAAAQLERAAEGFRLARASIERVRQARQALDTACLVLGETLPGMTEFDRPPLAAWLAVAETAARVATTNPANADAEEIAALAAGVTRLRADFGPAAVERLAGKDRRTDPEGVAALQALLTGAALGGAVRKPAWDSLLADTARLHASAREQDAGEDRPPPPVSATDPEPGRTLRRAEASVRLLRLAGAMSAGEAETLLQKAMAGGLPRDWDALGDRLRTAWLNELPEQVTRGGPAAIRVLRAVPPGLARYRPWADLPPTRTTEDDGLAVYRAWAEDAARPLVPEEHR
jgi:hypothetical protein